MKSAILLIKKDVLEWCRYFSRTYGFRSFCYFFLKYPEFRVLVKNRIRLLGRWAFFFRYIITISTMHHNLFIYTDEKKIGGGLVFHHAFATIISASEIGENCHIFQQVTIGNGRTGIPKLGNNVRIYAGAKIFGNITIGDDVLIGANSVVTKDVPSHSVIAGIPAKVIKKRNSYNDNWEVV